MIIGVFFAPYMTNLIHVSIFIWYNDKLPIIFWEMEGIFRKEIYLSEKE